MTFKERTISLKRVVVTGMGIISPVGKNLIANWNNIKEGKSGITTITKFDVTDFSVKIAGEISGYNGLDYFDRKEIRKIDPFIQYALIAADEAVNDSGISEIENKERCGTYISSGIGGISTIESNTKLILDRGPSRVSPFFIPSVIINLASGHVSIKHGLKGPNMANTTACASSTHSLGDSFRMIQRGDADVMVTGGSEFPLTPLSVAGFSNMKALSTRNDNPQKACRPFDKERDGFIMSEGAAILVLEELEHALNRGAKIYGEIVGYGFTGDAYHMTAPDLEADGATRSMKMALKDAGIECEKIDYINAHGTSTPFNDKLETLAIKKVFGDYAKKVNISSTKSMTGHMLGATGAAEAIYTLLGIKDSLIPATINYEVPDEECYLNYTPNKPVNKEINYALSNSFGFGGTNGTLIFSKFKD